MANQTLRPLGVGSQTLLHGNKVAGFYGEVNDIITADELRSITGVTQGTPMQTGDITWLKYSHNHKTLYVAKQPIQHSISWDELQSKDCVFGKMVVIDDDVYLLRLMQGANVSPASASGGMNDEWNNLIVPSHTTGAWGMYSDSDLGVDFGRSWCQEVGTVLETRVTRSVSIFGTNASSHSSGTYLWRPVLELLDATTILNKILILDNQNKVVSRNEDSWVEVGTEIAPELFENHSFEGISDLADADWQELYNSFEAPFKLLAWNSETRIPMLRQTVTEREYDIVGRVYEKEISENELEKIKGVQVN